MKKSPMNLYGDLLGLQQGEPIHPVSPIHEPSLTTGLVLPPSSATATALALLTDPETESAETITTAVLSIT